MTIPPRRELPHGSIWDAALAHPAVEGPSIWDEPSRTRNAFGQPIKAPVGQRALNAFGQPVEQGARNAFGQPAAEGQGAAVRISEGAPSGALATRGTKPGRFLLKLIDEGVGSSGYYPARTLKQAAADRVFAKDLHCYIDHAAALRRGPGGERSVRDLAAVLSEDARYDDTLKGLVAEAEVFGADAERLRSLAPHIGMSISAAAIMGPPVPGQTRPTVERSRPCST